MAATLYIYVLHALILSVGIEAQDVDVGLVAQISTYAYDDALNKGGLSFETKDGNDLLQVAIYEAKSMLCPS